MKKAIAVAVFLSLALVSVSADVTLVQKTTMEGPAAGMVQPGQLPTITMRIKGMKSRNEIVMMGQTVTAIADLAQKQVVLLQSDKKTAQVITPESVSAGGRPLPVPDVQFSLKSTGKTQTIDGVECAEHGFTMAMDLASFAPAGQMQPDAAAMLKDVKMRINGSMWIARDVPGAAELMAYNKAALDSKLLSAISGLPAGQSGGMEQLMTAAASAPGIPYLTEMTMVLEGTGPIVEAMKQMGTMKIVQKTTSVSTESIPDELFRIPDGYTIEKK